MYVDALLHYRWLPENTTYIQKAKGLVLQILSNLYTFQQLIS